MKSLLTRPLRLVVLVLVGWWMLSGMIASVEESLRQLFAWMFP